MTSDDENWYGPEAATFGDRLAAAREAAGMTPEQLARRLGVKSQTLKNWEADRSEPRANRLSMLAGLLNVSMMWLINGEGEGLEAPEENEIPSGLADLLIEIRDIRNTAQRTSERLALLEKRLRKTLAEDV